MIGFNGGLIGVGRDVVGFPSKPGIWTPAEQVVAQRKSQWSSSFMDTQALGGINEILIGSSVSVTLANLRTLLNRTDFQDKASLANYNFSLSSTIGASWSFSWYKVDISSYPKLFFRFFGKNATSCPWKVSGTGITTATGTVAGSTSTSYSTAVTLDTGSATIETTGTSSGLLIQDLCFGSDSSSYYVRWTV